MRRSIFQQKHMTVTKSGSFHPIQPPLGMVEMREEGRSSMLDAKKSLETFMVGNNNSKINEQH